MYSYPSTVMAARAPTTLQQTEAQWRSAGPLAP
jgi:hypothetical protein